MRNDNFYTGATSASIRSDRAEAIATKRTEQLKAKQQNRGKLAPAAELIKAEFAKEIARLRDIDYVEVESMLDDQHFRAEMMARKKTIEKLQAIQARLLNVVRETARPSVKQPETWEEMVDGD